MELREFLKDFILSNIVFGQVTLSKEEVRNIIKQNRFITDTRFTKQFYYSGL